MNTNDFMESKSIDQRKLKGQTTTWKDVKSAKVGHVFHDTFDEGLRFVVIRGPAALCAYVGIPKHHPLSGHGYEELTIDCHGGLTFAGADKIKGLDSALYWYGWDYGHAGDEFAFSDERSQEIHEQFSTGEDHKWLPQEVVQDAWNALYDFKKLMRLTEKVRLSASDRKGLSASAFLT